MDGQSLFTGQDLPSLRKPKLSEGDTTDIQLPDDLHNKTEIKTSNETIISKSTLSAEAAEFYPKGYQRDTNYFQTNNTQQNNIQTTKSVQSRLARPQPQINNIEIAPPPPPPQIPNVADIVEQFNEYGLQELEHLREIIFLLTLNPGKFDDMVPILIENLNIHFSDKLMMHAIVACIVDQAIEEHNFGYSGARLSVILNTNSEHFRDCLINYCDHIIQFDVASSDKARNYTLFLAELFSQLNWQEFGGFLLRMLDELLRFNQPDDIKCICQTLKLTGMSLEALNIDSMRNIIERLQERQPNLPPSYANLLNNVLELRAAQWGRSSIHNTTSTGVPTLTHTDYPPESPQIQRWSDGGPVFYGPDGLELSAEENAFLNDAADEITPEDSDPDALWDPDPEFDEEVGRAYKEFVEMTKK